MGDCKQQGKDLTYQKQIRLEQILSELSEMELPEGNDYGYYAKELINIYSGNFRHQYGSITGRLMSPEKNDEDLIVRINMLGENLRSVYEEMERIQADQPNCPSDYEDINRRVKKLLDHISLEQSRINYLRHNYWEQTNQLRKSMKESIGKLDEAYELAEKSAEESRGLKTEVISILSIFAALVLVFNGGFALLGNAYAGLGSGGYLAVSVVTVVAGIVMFNTVYALLYVASRLTGKHLGSQGHKDCSHCLMGRACQEISTGKDGKQIIKVHKLKRAFYKQPFWIGVNILLMMLLALLLIFGAVLSRNVIIEL